MKSSPRFSVIIPTYHRNHSLAKCLDCLVPGVQTLPAEQYEVIVTDDGSQTTAEEMIREHYPWVEWVAGPCTGPAANRNNGAKHARGEWLAFTDDDCLPVPNWLQAFAEATSESVLALEGAIHPLGDPNQDLAECPVNLTGGYFWSSNIAVQRSLFQKLGGFDQNYPCYGHIHGHEDQDLHLRLCPLTKILFVPDARVFHPVRLVSLKEAITPIPKRCAIWAYHVKKHKIALNSGGNLRFTLQGYKFYMVQLIKSLYRRRIKSVFVAFAYLTFGLSLVWLYLSRQQVKSI